MGTGEWLRGQTEHCILAVRGKVLEAARREHSRKLEEFYAVVDATSPGGKVELFCCQQRKGWQVRDGRSFCSITEQAPLQQCREARNCNGKEL